MKTFNFKNETYFPIKGWEHKYAITDTGKIVRILNKELNQFKRLGNNNARNIVFTETIKGIMRQEAFDKKTLAFDTFFPNKREQKTVIFIDGNDKNFAKSNLSLSNRNKPNSVKMSNSDLLIIKKMREEGKSLKEIKSELNLKCTTQNISNIINKR